jgi:hypothetical protein
MSRFGKLGKHAGGSRMTPYVIQNGAAKKIGAKTILLLTPAEEREAAKNGEPGFQTMEAFLDDCRQHLDDYTGLPWTYEDEDVITSSGMSARIFD